MKDPRAITQGSLMPSYAHLESERVDFASTIHKLRAMRNAGVPYSPERIAGSGEEAAAQAEAIRARLAKDKVEVAADTKLVALIAYLQRLGQTNTISAAPGADAGATVAVAGKEPR